MKLIMTLQVRNEQDIIKENIDYHLSQGVDFIIATDNCSTDSTREILKSYEKKGLLHYIYEPTDTHDQGVWVTKMARMASKEFQADWIINNDADEFWWPTQQQNLKETFISLDDEYNIVEAKRYNFIPMRSDNLEKKCFYQKMIHREQQSLNSAGQPLPPKQAHKANASISVSDGNHSVSGFTLDKINKTAIEIFHFPIRSKEQFTNKIRHGGAALERNTTVSKHTGSTWRKLYQQLKADGNLNAFLSQQHLDMKTLKEKANDGSIIIDKRLKKHLESLYDEY